LTLGQPLLVTGEPGTGKTQLAYSIAHELGLGEPFKYEVKSTTTSKDLFYRFDAVRQFHDSHSQRLRPERDYLEFNALGRAILLANEFEKVKDLWPQGTSFEGPRRSVVLIDEIDKAPRDIPNDLLNEVESMYFRLPELDNRRVDTDWAHRPVLIITSNSEKSLPEPFLRRCVYYHIPFPNTAELNRIIQERVSGYPLGCPLLVSALDLFDLLRSPGAGLRKRPGTAELLNWLRLLQAHHWGPNEVLREKAAALLPTLSILVKTEADQDQLSKVLATWRSR